MLASGTLTHSGLESREVTQKHQLTKADRLLERAQFVHLATCARKISNRHFSIFFEAGRGKRSRIGITVSRKVGNAVTRNRIKRLAREFFRTHRSVLKRAWDIHVIARKAAADGCSKTIFASLEQLFRRIESIENE